MTEVPFRMKTETQKQAGSDCFRKQEVVSFSATQPRENLHDLALSIPSNNVFSRAESLLKVPQCNLCGTFYMILIGIHLYHSLLHMSCLIVKSIRILKGLQGKGRYECTLSKMNAYTFVMIHNRINLKHPLLYALVLSNVNPFEVTQKGIFFFSMVGDSFLKDSAFHLVHAVTFVASVQIQSRETNQAIWCILCMS